MVDFVRGCVDQNAPEFLVSGVAGIERISPNQMRVSYFVRRRDELITVVHVVWDRDEWLKQWNFWDKARGEISHDCFELDRAISTWSEKSTH